MNGIENYPAAGENFLENVILKVSDTFSKDFYPKEGQCSPLASPREGLGINFSMGGGGREVPCSGDCKAGYPGGKVFCKVRDSVVESVVENVVECS